MHAESIDVGFAETIQVALEVFVHRFVDWLFSVGLNVKSLVSDDDLEEIIVSQSVAILFKSVVELLSFIGLLKCIDHFESKGSEADYLPLA